MRRSVAVCFLSVWQIAGFAVVVVPEAALAQSAVIGTSKPAASMQQTTSPGERVYVKWCYECHGSAVGPGTQVLEQKYKGQVPAILHQRSGIPVELVKLAVRRGMGFMSPFRKTEISDAELASLATYLSTREQHATNRKAGAGE